jgi:hypothetical protein
MTINIKKSGYNIQKEIALNEIKAEEMSTITIRIPRSLKERVKIKAIQKKTTITDIIVDSLKDYNLR